MVAYNFQERFADAVERGEKTQTIRAVGKRQHAQSGDTIQLYTGQRTKHCRKLGEAVCTFSIPVQINQNNALISNPITGFVHEARDLNIFAQADGFSDWREMRDWFGKAHGLPFEGVLIKWELKESEEE